jgi:hypothetical protein
VPAAAAAPSASAATLIPDASQPVTLRHPPRWDVPERKAPRQTARFAALGAVLVAAVGAAAYVGDQRNWLPDAFRRAGPESKPAPVRAAAAAPPAAPGAPPSTAPRADEGRQAGEAKRKAEEAAAERRRAEQRALEEQRDKAMAEYQRLQLDQIEAERRRYFEARKVQPERRKPDEPNAPPTSGSASSDDRVRSDAERKRLEEEQARRPHPQLAPRTPTAPSAGEERRRDFTSWPPDAPNAARRQQTLPPGDTEGYGPYPPPARGPTPRGWTDPGADEEY